MLLVKTSTHVCDYLDHNLQTCQNEKCVRTKVAKKNETLCDWFTFPTIRACFMLIEQKGAIN